jgi:hypothetical protein
VAGELTTVVTMTTSPQMSLPTQDSNGVTMTTTSTSLSTLASTTSLATVNETVAGTKASLAGSKSTAKGNANNKRDDGPLIGGIVGGTLALLLLLGIFVAFLRRRQFANRDGEEPLEEVPEVAPMYGQVPKSRGTHQYDGIASPLD